MKNSIILALMMAAVLLVLSSCAQSTISLQGTAVTVVPDTDAAVPALDAQISRYRSGEVMLYHRYYDEPYLAAESREVVSAPDRPYELAVVSALLEGPESRSAELNTLFPEGTRVISTALQGRTLFVTLSREVLNGYPDEPSSWQNDPYWSTEVPLRRQLAMQSLTATVTENCNADCVQVLVEQTSDSMSDSLRLKESYFMTGGEGLTGTMHRDESLLLTPVNTMDVIMSLWQSQDWSRLYRYISSSGRSGEADFITRMENLPRVSDFAVSGGSVSADGSTCLFTVTLSVAGGSEDMSFAFRLKRENDLWKIPQDQLTVRQEAM